MNRILAFVSVLVITSFALAQEVQFVEVGPFDALDKTLHYVREFDNAKPDSGTVNPHAIVCTVRMSSELTVSACIDADSPEAAKPNIIRLDFTGKGKFDDKMVLKLGKSEGPYNFFGPATLQVKIGQRTIPVAVQANYTRSESYRSLALIVGSGVQANCKIGDKEYMVRLLDGHDPNFKYNDKAAVGKQANVNTDGEADAGAPGGALSQCDTVAVYVPDKAALNGRRSITKGYYGQPVAVEGKWYDITLGADGRKIEVAAFTGQLGKVKLGGDWTCRLTGKKYLVAISGDKKLADLPVDEYTVDNAAAFSAADADGKKTKVTLYPTKPRKLIVSADKEAELTLGAPLLAKTQAQAAGRNVMLSMSLADSSGMRVVSIAQANGKMPDPPSVQVVDADGKMVYKTSLSYG